VFVDSLAISLLGLEKHCYENASVSEKASIKLILVSFFCVLILSVISSFLIGLLVSGRIIFAVPISILGTFILISIFRFSLILIKPEISILKQLNVIVLKTTWKEKWVNLKNQIQNLMKQMKNFRLNLNVPIPGFTIVFRLFYLGLLAFVIIFPLTLLLHWSDVKNYNEELRQKALLNYANTEKAFQSQAKKTSLKINLEEKLSWYEDKVSREYFTMKLFLRALNYPSFNTISFIVFFLFFLPHFLLFRLMRKPDYLYVSSVNKYFEQIISENFHRLEGESKQILKSKGFDVSALNLSFLSKNHPYQEKQVPMNVLENISWKSWQTLISIQNETSIQNKS
jgi:hypothetical protein